MINPNDSEIESERTIRHKHTPPKEPKYHAIPVFQCPESICAAPGKKSAKIKPKKG